MGGKFSVGFRREFHGRCIREFDAEGLVLLVLCGDKEIIPHGDTVLEAGDVLVTQESKPSVKSSFTFVNLYTIFTQSLHIVKFVSF